MSSPEEGFPNPTLESLRRVLTRYQPFIVTVAAIALIALLLPGKTSQTATQTTPSDNTAAAFGQAADGAAGGATTAGTAAAGSGAVAAARTSAAPLQANVLSFAEARKRRVALVRNCDVRTGRLMMPTWQAPGCVPRYNGTNGGSNWQGVTRDKIRIVYYDAQNNPAAQAILAAAGANDSKEQEWQQARDWVKLYSSQFNMWGRKIDLVFVDGSGSATDDAAAKSDAIKVAKQIKAFASINSPNNTYVNELKARGVMCMCTVELPDSFYQRWAPYVWTTLQSADHTGLILMEYLLKRLNNRNAIWAGDPVFQQQKRVFGLLQYETRDYAYKQGTELFVKEAKKRGINLHVAYFNGYPDLQANQEQARPIIQRMKAEGVTTLICGCDPFAPIFFTQEATRQVYRPEWVVLGSALTDTTFFGRTYDPEQWAHAYGFGQLVARLPEKLSDSYRLYTWFFHHDPVAPAGYGVQRAPFDLFFRGVHFAGPVLTPKTFQAGMFNSPEVGSGKKTVYSVGFGTKRYPVSAYTAFHDVTEIWWDRSADGPDEIGGAHGVGMYRYVNGGTRYLPGQIPSGLPKMFDPAGTITVYENYPPGEAPPNYSKPVAP